MGYALDENGHLDLSECFLKHGYDYFKVEETAREYYFTELTSITAWDGKQVRGLDSERKYRHVICKHNHDDGDLNVLLDLDIKRIEKLPLIKEAIEGRMHVEIYLQKKKRKEDKVLVVIEGDDQDYITVLGVFEDHYILRSSYPADEEYVKKVKRDGELIGEINPA